ncbi:hypothetical protein RF11_03588 [Thelohanellus kitauei]|uniref:Uncharacterized protein n=1 Tax=Thelohanellus kitauei TaxID=669202 RepID=A0A0C2MIK0_THEKT|nr:hypothetical protein RF11_03588 [Thelohanellus kitauei]
MFRRNPPDIIFENKERFNDFLSHLNGKIKIVVSLCDRVTENSSYKSSRQKINFDRECTERNSTLSIKQERVLRPRNLINKPARYQAGTQYVSSESGKRCSEIEKFQYECIEKFYVTQNLKFIDLGTMTMILRVRFDPTYIYEQNYRP